MNAPEFRPRKNQSTAYKVGDAVSFTHEGREVIGTVADVVGDTFIIESPVSGQAFPRKAGELHPIQRKPAPPPITSKTIAKHLKAGGEAYYTPSAERYGADEGKLDFEDRGKAHAPIPLHTTWLGKRENLDQFVNFDDIASGKAKLEFREAGYSQQSKPPRSREPTDRMHDRELKNFIKAGNPKGFDTFPQEDHTARYGKHTLGELLANKDLHSDTNIQAWIDGARKAAAARKAAGVQPEGSDKNPVKSSGTKQNAVDNFQTMLDGVGVVGDAVVPGAGVAADGANAAISLLRAATDKKRRGEHLKNAAISGVSTVPFVGDLAKAFKYGARATRKRGGDQSEEEAAGNGSGGGGPPDSGSAAGGSNEEDPLSKRSSGFKQTATRFLGAVGKLAVATIGAATSVSLLNKAAIEYHRNLTKYNGVLAESYGKLEADRAKRAIREGQELSGPLSGLVRNQSKLEDAFQDLKTDWKVIGADVSSGLAVLATLGVRIVDKLDFISDAYVNKIRPVWQALGWVPGETKVQMSGWMDQIRKKAEDNAKRPRKV